MADAYRGLTIRIGGDTTKLTAALRAAQKAASQTQSQLRAIDKAARFDPESISNASLKIRLMEERAQDLASQLKTTNQAYNELGSKEVDGTTIRQLAEQTDNAALAAQRALERYNAVDAELEQMYTAINKAAQASGDFSDNFDLRKADDIESVVQQMVELGTISQDDADKLTYLREVWNEAFKGNETAKAVQTFRELEVKAEGLNSELKNTHTQLSSLKAPSNLSTSFSSTATAVKRIDSQIKILESDARKADEALQIDPTNMAAAQRKMADLAKATELANEKVRLLSSAVEAYKSAGVDTLAKGMGEATVEAEKANEAYAEVSQQLSEAKAHLEQLYTRQQRLADTAKDTGSEYEQVATEIEQAKAEVVQLENAERQANEARDSANMAKEYAELSSKLGEAKTKAQQLSEAMQDTGSASSGTLSYMKELGTTLSATVSPIMKQIGEYALTSASDIDSAYRDMRKTVNGTEGDFTKLKQAAIDFSNTNVTSADQILSIQAIGGELGVAVEDLQMFAETVSNLDIATNLDTETAAEDLGHLANIMDDLNNNTMTGFSDALVRLGNNGASTESEIMEIATRIGSMASIVGMSTPEVLALASSIASTGQNSEAAGTAISNTMSDIESAVAEGGDALTDFANVSGMSAEEFAKTWNESPIQALKAFIEGLKNIESNGGSADATLQSLGITGVRQKQAIMGLMQTIEGLNDNLEMSQDAWNGVSDEWGAAGDAANEAKAKNEGLSGSLSRLQNIAKNAASSLGDALAPIVSNLADKAVGLEEAFEGTSDGFKVGVASVGAFTVALGPALRVTSDLFTGLGKVKSAITNSGQAWSKMTNSVSAASKVLGVAKDSTEAVQLATEGLSAAQKIQASASTVATAALGGLKTIAIGLAVAGIGALVTSYIQAEEHTKLVKDATTDLTDIVGNASTSVEGLGDSLDDTTVDTDEFLQSMVDLKDQISDSFTEIATNNVMLDKYVSIITELGNKDLPLTASEQDKLATAVKGYNDITGQSLSIIDETTGKLSSNTEEIKKNAEAWKDKAKAEGYSSAAAEYYKKEAEAAVKLSTAQEDLTKKQEALNKAKQDYADAQAKVANGDLTIYSEEYTKAGAAVAEATTAYNEAKASVDELAESEKTAADNAAYASLQAEILGSSLDTNIKAALTSLPIEMQEMGYNIANSLSGGIENGSISVTNAISFINSAMNLIGQLPEGDAREKGMAVATELATGISDGSVSASDALAQLDSAIADQLDTTATRAGETGAKAGQNLAANLSASSGIASEAASTIAASVEAGVNNLPSSFGQTGSSAGSALSSTLASSSGSVSASASSLSSAAKDGVSDMPDEFESTGSDAAKSMGTGIADKTPGVVDKTKSLAEQAMSALDVDSYSKGVDFGAGFKNGISSMVGTVVSAATSLAQKALSAIQKAQNSHSPSKVTKGFGNDFGDGYIIGIEQRAKQAARAATYMTSRALDAVDMDSRVSTLAIDTRLSSSRLSDIQATSSGTSVEATRMVKEMRNLRKAINNLSQPTYVVNGITYDDGTSTANAIKDLTHAIKVERRV